MYGCMCVHACDCAEFSVLYISKIKIYIYVYHTVYRKPKEGCEYLQIGSLNYFSNSMHKHLSQDFLEIICRSLQKN